MLYKHLLFLLRLIAHQLYQLLHVYSGINKYKKRRFHKTVNLLTGETDVHPDLIQVSHFVIQIQIWIQLCYTESVMITFDFYPLKYFRLRTEVPLRS